MNTDEREVLRAKTHILNPAMWILDNEFINENQAPFEFDLHRFMLQPYSDSSPDQVIMKSAQVGWSVAAILKSIHAAKFLKLNVIYVLPTRNIVHDFVIPKVNPMIERNPAIRDIVKGTDSTNLKKVGDRFIYFRGAFHRGEAVSTTADLVISDEHDVSDQGVLIIYQSRLQASKYGWFWRFSNPTIPGFGVHELYQESDQMHWMVTCPGCNHEWFMDMVRDEHTKNHYIDVERKVYACGRCGKALSDDARQAGRWVAKYPGRERRGYWLSQLIVPWVSAKKILAQQESMAIDVFHNFVLGLPYQASEFLINREAILRSNQQRLANKQDVAIGCDSGKVKHWVMGNPQGVFSYGKADSWDEIEQLINLYDATCVIDALPDFTVPEQLARKYPGKVFVHYYTHDSKSIDTINRKEGAEFGVIQSDRTKLFDMLAAEISNKTMNFFQPPDVLEELMYHFEQVYRVVELDTKGIQRARWETKENRPDHFAHATAYYRVALSLMILTGETGGVTPNIPSKVKPSYKVRPDDTVPIKEALGMDLDTLVERSVAKNRRHRVE